jgi:CubicO group peptidase (beta-lactamase class C family)
MRNLRATRFAVLAFLALAPGTAMAQAQKAPAPALYTGTTLEAVFNEWVERRQPKSAVLVLRRGGKTIFQKGHDADPAKPTFIASMTKSITGACVATLVRDGKLSFTTPMKEALPKHARNTPPRRRTARPQAVPSHAMTAA